MGKRAASSSQKKRKPGVIRRDGIRVDVYNEGLCVYLFDEGSLARLRKMIEERNKRSRSRRWRTFFDHLSYTPFAREVNAHGLALAYTLEQDDEVSVEVATGKPLDPEELAVACWLEPQRARLALPTGRLRIETPNTVPLDPDEKSDGGGIVEVPPGDYVVTLYRIDWDELRRQRKGYKGPDEFILLTPARDAGAVEAQGPILEFNPRKEPSPGRVKIDRKKASFTCKLVFLGYWERYALNITRKSAARIGLTPGAVMRLRIDKFVLDAVFLGDMTCADFLRYFTAKRLEEVSANRAELAIGEWSDTPKKDCLVFFRVQARRCVPERLLDRWFDAKGELLPERWDLPRRADVPVASASAGVVRAGVTFASPEEAVIEIGEKELAAIRAKPGSLLRLESSGGGHRTLAICGDPETRDQHLVLTRRLPGHYEQFLHRMAEDDSSWRFCTMPGAGGHPPYEGTLPAVALDHDEQWPVAGALMADVGDPARQVLRIMPFRLNGEPSPPAGWIEGLAAGTRVELRLRR